MEQYHIGVDLGGTNIKAGLVDHQNRIVQKISRKTKLPRPQHDLEEEIASMCRELAKLEKLDFDSQILSIGIGVPGSVDSAEGVIAFSANFAYQDWHLQEHMRELLPCRIYLENDANAAAYGEYTAGAARGAQSVVAVTLGTGVGGGIIIGGEIFSGCNSAGAELGHTVIVKDGRPCSCGRKGCWEQYASARALTEDTREAMRRNPGSRMWKLAGGDLARVSARTSFDAMRAGDPEARKLVHDYVSYVACGLVNLINIFQPEIICIGGGISAEGETLLGPIREIVDLEDYARVGLKRSRIVPAQLRNDAGIIGAAALAAKHD